MSKRPVGSGNTPKAQKQQAFQIKKVAPGVIASVVLEELSRAYADSCNLLEAASLARRGELFLALESVAESFAARGGLAETRPQDVWVKAQAEACLKKCTDPAYDPMPDTAAKWFRTERRVELLNRKFDALTARRKKGVKETPFRKELYRFYEALCYVLGEDVPEADIASAAYYGPGSTTDVRGSNVHFVRKVESFECAPLCVGLASQALMHDKASWSHLGLDASYAYLDSAREGFLRVARERLSQSVSSQDRLMFIFKSMTARRSIGAQPTCSGMVQLGFHVIATEWLRERAGIDLQDQEWNRTLAAKGSRGWEDSDPWCTLDKSDASNRIANGLIKNLFPPAWAKFFMRTRTPGYEAPPELGGGQHTYHMYAGMGNGTTFVVETLIFWAGTYATQDLTIEEYVRTKPYAVYGDDVILRRGHAERYMRFARFLGFVFNPKKTFLEGPFRESCGADFYAGVPVRPAYLEVEGDSVDLQTLVAFHNTLADNKVFPLEGACNALRKIARTHLYPILPTDPQGNLGFRPSGDRAHYDVVRDKEGRVLVSPAWQRPRTFLLDVKPKMADLGTLDGWTQIAVALLRARQASTGSFSLPVRGFVNYKVVSEKDLVRQDLVTMVLNQLRRLAIWKNQPWWKNYRG